MLFFLIALISFLLQLFLPWWIIAPVSFAAGFRRGRSMRYSFVSAFLAIFCLWIVVGLTRTLPNNNILANRIGGMLGLPDTAYNWIAVLLLSGLLGGLAAGFSAMAGYYTRRARLKEEKPAA